MDVKTLGAELPRKQNSDFLSVVGGTPFPTFIPPPYALASVLIYVAQSVYGPLSF